MIQIQIPIYIQIEKVDVELNRVESTNLKTYCRKTPSEGFETPSEAYMAWEVEGELSLFVEFLCDHPHRLGLQ